MNKLNSSQGKQLREIAAYLKQKRIEQSLSLEQIASRTFIRLHILEALETAQVEELPELIYVQGFIRRYAEVLRIDGNSLAKRLTQTDNAVAAQTPPEPKPEPKPQLKIQPQAKPQPQPQPKPKPEVRTAVATPELTSPQFLQRDERQQKTQVEELVPASRPPQPTNVATRSVKQAASSAKVPQSETTENVAFGRYWPLMAVIGCLGASLGLLYALTRSPAREPSKASLSETPLKSTVAKSPQTTPINTSSSEIITKPDSEKPTISPSPVASPQAIAPSPSPQAIAPSPSPIPSPQASPPITGPLSVAVALEGTSWLKVQVDGKTEYEGILEQGVKQNWTAKEKLIIIAGNAGAVSYAVNQQPSQRLGEPGEVKEIQLTPTESNPTP